LEKIQENKTVSYWMFPGLSSETQEIFKKNIPIRNIVIREVKKKFSYDFFIKSNRRVYVLPRQIFHFLMREFTKESLEAIGYPWDHATVSHSVRCVKNEMETYKEFKIMIQSMMKNLKEQLK